jgi:hypothetical protein
MPEYIDMTPTDEGYANIAMVFAASILSDVKVSRREDARVILDSLVDIVSYLGQKDPALVKRVRGYIRPEPVALTIHNHGAYSCDGPECTSDDPTNHQGDWCPVHEGSV